MIKSIIIFWSTLSVLMTLLPFLKLNHWTVRFFDFPRVQVFVITLVTLLVFLPFFDTTYLSEDILLSLLIGSLLYQAKMIFPYTTIAPKQSIKADSTDQENELSIIVANVLGTNRSSADLLQMIDKWRPDVVLLLEVNDWWEQELLSLEADYPFRVKETRNNLYGMHLYSKLKLINTEIKHLVEEDIPSIHTHLLLRSQEQIQFYGLHPRPPSPTENSYATERDAELLIVGKQIDQMDGPVIVAGDLNDVAWSYTTKLFLKISGLSDPRKGRGFFNTFHAEYRLMRWPLDHVFHTANFKLIQIERLPYFGSDHFPIFIKLSLDKEVTDQRAGYQPTYEEREEAEERIKKSS